MTSNDSCEHYKAYRETAGLGTFRIIQAYFVFCKNAKARKDKAIYCICQSCGVPGLRLQACLYCMFFGCYSYKHINEHAKSMNHNLAVDINFGSLYCFICKDNVYDEELETIIQKYKLRCLKTLGINVPWEPSPTEIKLLLINSRRLCVTENSYIGLRGLLNLGKTCFINCIIQVLTHTPVFRDYFLSERHTCNYSECLMCEMVSLFQEFYTGEIVPFVPSRLLYLVWTHSTNLKGNLQQDAHEFFMEALNTLHEHSIGIPFNSNIPPLNSDSCDCIVDQVFTGTTQSNVTCQECKNISPKGEKFRDIALDIVRCGDDGSTSLEDCLRGYITSEKVGSVMCSRCGKSQESTKQVTLEKLPVIASFQLKRFEQTADNSKNSGAKKNGNNAKRNSIPKKAFKASSFESKKNATFVSFPPCIDLTPFTTAFVNERNSCANANNKYTLFGVVNHDGDSIGQGHYTSYIRLCREKWFKCNDHTITCASVEDVLNSQGYVLFYYKNYLEYE